jgi:hypothetical protein
MAQDHGFTVRDALIGDRPGSAVPDVEIGFLVHPELDVSIDGATATIARDGEALLRISGQGGLALAIHEGTEAPARGWYSERFGSRRPAPQLVFKPDDADALRFEITLEIIAPPTRGGRRKAPAKGCQEATSAR